jgi:uridine phosphorylase
MPELLHDTELILNADGSVYHLALLPEDVAPIVILVGDQDRVPLVSRHFDKIDIKKQKREFQTHTGWIGQKRISVVSTGIGTDNVDIVINELDALVNIDFSLRQKHSDIRSLNIFRIGTSGSIHPDIHLHDIVASVYAIGTDTLGLYYGKHESHHELLPSWSYLTKASSFDLSHFPGKLKEGTTLTCPGFYAAQGRALRMIPEYKLPTHDLHSLMIHGFPITNIEMETAAIYLLADKLGHQAHSFNVILAERLTKRFSSDPLIHINVLIENTLSWIVSQ